MTSISEIRASGTELIFTPRPIYEPLNAPEPFKSKLGRFEDNYDLSTSSHLFRFLLAVCGEAGAGALKRELLYPKLQQSLESTHFYDLDRLYGDPLALPRLSEELYNIDPRNQVMTQDEWQEVLIKDAQYRSRCLIWMRAIIEGPSPRGIELAAEAATGVECQVFERYKFIENAASDDPIVIPDLGMTNSVNEFVILPRTAIVTEQEKRRIMKLVDKLRPVNTIFSTEILGDPRDEQSVRAAAATSSTFYVERFVTGRSDVVWPAVDLSQGYWIEPGIEKEVPAFAWFSRQETATFLSIASATASSEHVGPFNAKQRELFPHLMSNRIDFVYDESYAFAKAFAPVQLTSPWTRTTDSSVTLVNQYYPLGYFAENGIAQLPADDPTNFWSSNEAFAPAEESLILDLSTTRPINFLDLEICYKPIDMFFEHSLDGITWAPFVLKEEFNPQWQSKYIATTDQPWNYTEHHFFLEEARYIRITFARREENFPFPDLSEPIEWSVDVRNLRCAHVITAAEDFVTDAGTDILGNAYRTDIRELPATNILERSWSAGGDLTLVGDVITDAIRDINVKGDGLDEDSSFGIWEPTTNLITNGGFETNTAGWVAWGDAGTTLVRSTAQAKFGGASGLITTSTGATDGAHFNIATGIVPGNVMTWSIWVRPAVEVTMRLQMHHYFGGTGTAVEDPGGPFVVCPAGEWTRLSMTQTIPPTTNNTYFIVALGGTPTATTIHIDGGQVEVQPFATPYVHTDGSTVARLASRVSAPTNLLNKEKGWVAMRVRHGWNTSTEPYGGSGYPFYFNLQAGGSDRITGAYIESTNSYYTGKVLLAGGETNVQVATTVVKGQEVTLIFGWTEDTVSLSVNGSVFATTTLNDYIPAGAIQSLDIGNNFAGNHIDGEILWCAFGQGELTSDDAADIHAMLSLEADPIRPAFPGDPTAIMTFDDETILTPRQNTKNFWQSQANPVANAVEALYLDLRLDIAPGTMQYLDTSDFVGGYSGRTMTDMENYAESGQIVDEVWIDPITFGPNMHIYYSVDDYADYDYKLWIPVPRHYVLKKGYHALPSPVFAKYIKFEFSNLSPSPYNSLDYPVQPEVTYRKFPSWVQSHFNGIYEDQKITQGDFNVPYDRVVIDPLSFGFEIQQDRLHSDLASIRAEDFATNEDEVKDFIQSITKTAANAELVQQTQESQINYYPSFMWRNDMLDDLDRTRALSRYVQNTETEIQAEQNPPVEDSPDIQSLEDLTEERLRKELPIMFFPRKCRHEYQILKTTRPTKVAYMVSIRDIRLYRRDYTAQYDEVAYFGSLDDDYHTDVNEFTLASDWGWVVTP
jgi:hypothetical protein